MDERSVLTNFLKSSYVFQLTEKHSIDAYFWGNKARFINHASNGLDNTEVRLLLVKGVYRVGMFATKHIETGEELLFNYGEGYVYSWRSDFDKKAEHLMQGYRFSKKSNSMNKKMGYSQS